MWQIIGAIVNAVKGQKASQQKTLQAQQEQIEAPAQSPEGTDVSQVSQAPPPAAPSSKLGGVIGSIASGAEGGGGGEGMVGALDGGMEAYGSEKAGSAGELGAIDGGGSLPQAPAPQAIDVMGGETYGDKAAATAEKTSPAIQDYLKNAVKEYARQKMARKLGGASGIVAAAADSGGAGEQGEFGQKVTALSEWLNDTPEKQRARRKGRNTKQ